MKADSKIRKATVPVDEIRDNNLPDPCLAFHLDADRSN
jgi:hypothetical protein